jgi:uncharacterized protein
MIDCAMRGRDGSKYTLQYDPGENVLSREKIAFSRDTSNIVPPQKELSIRLSIGKTCNFRCKYCLMEGRERPSPDSLSPAVLVREILRFAGNREIGTIQFWGGEPLLPDNFEKIKDLYAAFAACKKMPRDFFLSTNGSLLYGEQFDWLLKHNICVSVSWDGPGQHLRGPDVLKDAQVLESVLALSRSAPDRLTFNPVMTSENRSYSEYARLLENVLGQSKFSLSEAKLPTIGDDAAWDCRVPESALPAYSRDYYQYLLKDGGERLGTHYVEATGFVCGLGSTPDGVRCFASNPETLTLDMAGNILTCQNFSAEDVDACGDSHCLGSIFDLPAGADAPMPELTRWKEYREHCKDCAVRFICRGGCPYTAGKYRQYNCLAGYHQSLPIFALALHIITGDLLAETTPNPTGEHHA